MAGERTKTRITTRDGEIIRTEWREVWDDRREGQGWRRRDRTGVIYDFEPSTIWLRIVDDWAMSVIPAGKI